MGEAGVGAGAEGQHRVGCMLGAPERCAASPAPRHMDAVTG